MVLDSNDRRPRGRGWGAFLAAARRSPRDVGTVLPSGRALADRLAAVVPRAAADGRRRVVVELGAGAGAVTNALVERAAPGTLVLAVEKDPGLADVLRGLDLAADGVQLDVVTADAITVPALLAERGVAGADALVSVLPWTLLPADRQRELLDVFTGALRPDGVFTAAAYLSGVLAPSARRFRTDLERAFHEVLPTAPMWRHLPPAMTYVCRQPIR